MGLPLTEGIQVVTESHTGRHRNTKPALCRRLAAPACFENLNLPFLSSSTLWVEHRRVWAPRPAPPRLWEEAPHSRLRAP